MTPRPPTWIRHKITIFPKVVKKEPVSTTVSPVTQTAEVAVNKASIKDIEPVSVAHVVCSNAVPIIIIMIKLNKIVKDGLSL